MTTRSSRVADTDDDDTRQVEFDAVGRGWSARRDASAAANRLANALIGGIRYYDTVVDDARHTMTVARTAAHYGAVVRNSTQVVAMLTEGDRVVRLDPDKDHVASQGFACVKGLKFAIREGGRTVGSGVVTEIVE